MQDITAIIRYDGALLLNRKGGSIIQTCPFDKNYRCGDQCPLFLESLFGPKSMGDQRITLACSSHEVSYKVKQDQREES